MTTEEFRESQIREWIEEKRKSWEPKTKTSGGIGYHGSNKGEEMEYTMYYDVKNWEWVTDEEKAFKGFLYTELDKILRKTKS